MTRVTSQCAWSNDWVAAVQICRASIRSRSHDLGLEPLCELVGTEHLFDDAIQAELGHAHVADPRGARERAVLEHLPDPVAGMSRVALLDGGTRVKRPAGVVALVAAHW